MAFCFTQNGKQKIVCLITCILMTTWVGEVRGASKCEAIDIPLCQRMPWNITRMPNLLHHSNQENARLAIEPYLQLVDAKCSNDLEFFLCSMFAPICTQSFNQAAIQPCRSVCLRAKRGCEPLMNRYNVSWPRVLDCSSLPHYTKGICISPEAIVDGPKPEPPLTEAPPGGNILIHSTRLSTDKDCQCEKKEKFNRKLYLDHKYDYAIKATFQSAEGIIGGPLILKIRVLSVLKDGRISIPTRTDITLWGKAGCICQSLIKGQDYLFLGFEDVFNKRILFDKTCLAVVWRKSLSSTIKKWEARLLENRKKDRRRKRKKNKNPNRLVSQAKDTNQQEGSEVTPHPRQRHRNKSNKKRRRKNKKSPLH